MGDGWRQAVKRLLGFALAPASVLIAASCTSATEDSGPTLDAGAETAPTPDGARGDDTDSASPAPDAGEPKPLDVVCAEKPCYVAVSGSGGHHVCGLLDDGTVRCWGRDSLEPGTESSPGDGALGRGVPVSAIEGAKPAPVPGLSIVTQLAVGPNFGTCARTSDGAVYCWGRNDFGQLGRPPAEPQLPMPTRVEGIPPVDHVALGYRAACAIATAEHALYCWGAPRSGLGVDAGEESWIAPQVAPAFRPPVKAVAIGTWPTVDPWDPSVFTDEDTVIALVGNDVLASIGNAPAGESSLPPEQLSAPLELPGVARMWSFAYGATDGRLKTWRPSVGVLSVPAIPAHIVDVKIAGVNQAQHGGVLLASGRLFRWGSNTAGALGLLPHELAFASYPMEMTQVARKTVSFATTEGSTCASLVDGKVSCWGANGFGELGRGTLDLDAHPEAEVIR
ncbi:MAG: repeat domain protein [Labilithrix sp.]|nr:repeat domain protein [Labilithrix sp.]